MGDEGIVIIEKGASQLRTLKGRFIIVGINTQRGLISARSG